MNSGMLFIHCSQERNINIFQGLELFLILLKHLQHSLSNLHWIIGF
nr:hypothetical protein Iba_chr05aCG16050 [Ipomoea batatas]GMC96281.1 hypothetical protein Iba_chr05cCG16570 [Ipomoea batatas]